MQDYMGGVELVTPEVPEPALFDDAKAAVDRLCALYDISTQFLCDRFQETIESGHPGVRFRAFYPEVRIATTSFAKVDSRLSETHTKAIHRSLQQGSARLPVLWRPSHAGPGAPELRPPCSVCSI